jgi:hypothetical protein
VTWYAPEQDSPRFVLLLSLVAINLLARFPYLAVEGAFEGFQNYTLKNVLSIVMAVAMSVVLYLYMERFDGLIAMAAMSSMFMVIKYLVGIELLRVPRYGGLMFSPGDCSWAVFRRSLSFGIKSFIQGLASRISWEVTEW